VDPRDEEAISKNRSAGVAPNSVASDSIPALPLAVRLDARPRFRFFRFDLAKGLAPSSSYCARRPAIALRLSHRVADDHGRGARDAGKSGLECGLDRPKLEADGRAHVLECDTKHATEVSRSPRAHDAGGGAFVAPDIRSGLPLTTWH
jgi:hypothetical protein